MHSFKKIVLSLPLLLIAATVQASESALNRFFEEVTTLQADFILRIVDETGMTLESSSGIFSLLRPGKFRWNYNGDDPDTQGLQIISDGKIITFYEPDLETASRRSFSEAIEQVPTMVLVQSGGDLNKHFAVTDYGLTDGLSWVALKPLDADAGYRELMIGFSGELIDTIVLTDGLGNETRLLLRDVQRNMGLENTVFEFDPPAGVDVVE